MQPHLWRMVIAQWEWHRKCRTAFSTILIRMAWAVLLLFRDFFPFSPRPFAGPVIFVCSFNAVCQCPSDLQTLESVWGVCPKCPFTFHLHLMGFNRESWAAWKEPKGVQAASGWGLHLCIAPHHMKFPCWVTIDWVIPTQYTQQRKEFVYGYAGIF